MYTYGCYNSLQGLLYSFVCMEKYGHERVYNYNFAIAGKIIRCSIRVMKLFAKLQPYCLATIRYLQSFRRQGSKQPVQLIKREN